MPKNVMQTIYGANLDATIYKTFNREKLMEQILQDVKDSQTFAGRHLPDKLLLTKDQFELLEGDMERMADTKDRMYITPLNCMEVQVVG